MKDWLIGVTVLLALLGWLLPTPTPWWATASAVLLLGISGIIQLRLARTERRAKASSAQTGVLESHRPPVAPKQPQLPKLEIGDSGAVLHFAGPQGQPLFEFFDDCQLTVEVEDGELKVSTVIRDNTGKVVAELLKNEWKVSSGAYDRNFSRDALEVRDASGDVVLQVRFVGDRVQFQGKFFDKTGRGAAIGKATGPDGVVGGKIEITGPGHTELRLKFVPIFKYPSERHLGELA